MFRKPTPRTFAYVTMYTGMVATLAGNALAADWSDTIAVIMSALPALALFVVFEMTTRSKAVPSRRRWYHKAMRLIPSVVIMATAAKLSLGHLMHVAEAHGHHGTDAVLLALLPDAMMLLAAVILQDSPQTRTTATPAPAKKAPAAKKSPAKTRKPATRKPANTAVVNAPAAVPAKTAAVPALITPTIPARRTRVLTAA